MTRHCMIAVICAAQLTTLGCGQKHARDAKQGVETVNDIQLQLNWLPDAQHGGFYAAQHAGHFSSEGLDVEIVPGGPGTAIIQKVAMGRCEFAIANADQVLLARAQGADVVAIFAAMQDSPRCIMVHESSGISSLAELTNVTLALGSGKAFAEFLKREVPLNNVRIVAYSGTVAKFLVDDNFAQQAYVFSEPITANEKGGDPKALMLSEIGFNPYSSVLITRGELLREQPELINKVVRAITAGWTSYLDSPDATNELIHADNPEMSLETLSKSVASIRELCLPSKTTALGNMTPERWSTLLQQLVELNLIPEDTVEVSKAFVSLAPSP